MCAYHMRVCVMCAYHMRAACMCYVCVSHACCVYVFCVHIPCVCVLCLHFICVLRICFVYLLPVFAESEVYKLFLFCDAMKLKLKCLRFRGQFCKRMKCRAYNKLKKKLAQRANRRIQTFQQFTSAPVGGTYSSAAMLNCLNSV